jgi:hypothetical protein
MIKYKRIKYFSNIFAVLFISLFKITVCNAQIDKISDNKINVILDCPSCNQNTLNYLYENVSYINFTRIRQDADVYVILLKENAANRGHKYSLILLGQNGYYGLSDTLTFNIQDQIPDAKVREKILDAFEIGIIPYLIKNSSWESLSVDHIKPSQELKQTEDKWNNWIFKTELDGAVEKNSSYAEYNASGEIQASKIVEEYKLDIEIRYEYQKERYKIETDNVTSIHRDFEAHFIGVKSMSQHWSLGGFTALYSSKYSNYLLSYAITPALEYNVFPYKKATTMQFTLLYRPGFRYNIYEDTTLYNKISEKLFYESLSTNCTIIKKWGSVNGALLLSHYFHDFSKSRLSFSSLVRWNVFKGFNIYLRGGVDLIHDQIELLKGEGSREEILTKQRQLETIYEYGFRVGIGYTFGSTTNNIVNQRFPSLDWD